MKPPSAYIHKISQNSTFSKPVLDMPINYLAMYGETVKGTLDKKRFLNLNFVVKPNQTTPISPITYQSVLLVFKKKNTGQNAEEICTLPMLNVSMNGVQVFSEEMTNCTINVKIDKSKVIQGINLEWVRTQEGATISEGKQKLTARVVSDAQTVEWFELTTKFMNQSYMTGGEVAAIVVGSVSAAFVVGIIITCIFANCECFKVSRSSDNVYQM